jgi:hypothetical protein
MKFWKLALLAAVGLALSSQADASVYYTLAKADTVARYAADSSGVMPIDGAERLWLDIVALPLRVTDIASACDTFHIKADADGALVGGQSYAYVHMDSVCTAYTDSVNTVANATNLAFAVQAREVLTSQAGTDSTYASRLAAYAALTDPAASATATYIAERSTAAAYADSTVIPWFPRGYVVGDSTIINHWSASNAGAGSSEQTAYIMARVGPWSSKRSVRVEFVTPDNGRPFRAQFASFRWRLIAGPVGSVRLRVVLGRDTK